MMSYADVKNPLNEFYMFKRKEFTPGYRLYFYASN